MKEKIEEKLNEIEERINFAKENGCKLLDCKVIDNNIKLRQENIKLKKIAKKLAEYGVNCAYGIPVKFKDTDELMAIVREEVENETNKARFKNT